MNAKILPSLMCLEEWKWPEALKEMEQLGIDRLHVDVCDGHYLPNLVFGKRHIDQLRALTDIPLDIHLMGYEVPRLLELLDVRPGDWISFHPEAEPHTSNLVSIIQNKGALAGVTLAPSTPLYMVEYLLDDLHFVNQLMFSPGFPAQRIMNWVYAKIAQIRKLANGRELTICVDGGVSYDNFQTMLDCGADALIVGYFCCFCQGKTITESIKKLADCMNGGLA